MTAILTAAEMRALEQAAIASGEVTGLELMERAGRGVVEAILAEWPEIEGGARRAVVLCGPGNNGGDGFVVARLLKERGWGVEAFLYGDAGRLPPDASANYERWSRIGTVSKLDHQAAERFRRDVKDGWRPDTSLWVDAIFGIGLGKPVGDDLGFVLESIGHGFTDLIQGSPGKIVAVDVPSGISSETGLPWFTFVQQSQSGHPHAAALPPLDPGEWWDITSPRRGPGGPRYWPLHAKLTVTFQTLKPGHLLGEGPRYGGKVTVVDIGLSAGFDMLRPAKGDFLITEARPDYLPSLEKRIGHKYGYGHAVILSGGAGKGGAARMAARSALRIGAGLVTLAVSPAALQENAARLDAIMLRSLKGPEALTDALSDARLNALCVGPGFGTGERQAAMLTALLDAADGAGEGKPRPVVLDADALTLLARDPTLRAKLHPACVLTPHEGEFARLFPAIDAKWRAPAATGLAFSKVDAAREAAREAGCVVLLKGPDTVIADPSGRAAINAAAYDRAAPWLATAGSGDVLAGFITGLLARGLNPFDAACTAAWLHVECARSFGPGLIAEDLPEELPKVLRALGL